MKSIKIKQEGKVNAGCSKGRQITFKLSGIFIADTKPISQTLKVNATKSKKGSFKLIMSYKMKAIAGESIPLLGTGKEIKAYNIRYLANATNNEGENKFTDYF